MSRSVARAAAPGFAALALVLAAIVFLPWGAWLGAARPHEVAAYATTVWSWLRWLAVVVTAAALVALLWGSRVHERLERWRAGVLELSGARYALAVAGLAAAAGALLSGFLFSNNPHLVDTIAQLFQARIFARGRLTAPAPDAIEFFGASHLVQYGGRWFSQYPPGHPALLAIGSLAGLPWLVNPLFAGATVLLAYAAARRLLGEGSAKLAAALYVLSPFALFMSASYMNHVTTGFFLALALYAAVRAVEGDGGRRWPVIAGAALGLGAAIRPLECAAWAVVLGAWILLRRGWRPALVAGAVCVASLAPLFIYNGLTTGHPLRFGYTLLWGPGHGLGFHTDPWGEPFTPIGSFANTALDFQRLNVFLFGWPFPSLIFALVAIAAAGVDERLRKSVPLLTGLLLAAPAAYFFYWHRDDYLGPRFLYASLVPAILLTAVGIAALDARLGRWKGAFRLTVLAGALFAIAVSLPNSAGVVAGRMPGMKLHPEVEAARAGIGDAVVFVKVGWGNRLIARLWSWGIPASETERTFRVVDGCRLQLALDEADSLAASDSARARRRLGERLRAWREADLPLVKDVWPDPTVRVDTTRALDERCYHEVQRDRTGFTLYGSLVWRNDPWLRRGIIYARDLGPERDRRLMARYPRRDYYLYAPLSPARGARPVLRRLVLGPQSESRSPAAGASGAAGAAGEVRR